MLHCGDAEWFLVQSVQSCSRQAVRDRESAIRTANNTPLQLSQDSYLLASVSIEVPTFDYLPQARLVDSGQRQEPHAVAMDSAQEVFTHALVDHVPTVVSVKLA